MASSLTRPLSIQTRPSYSIKRHLPEQLLLRTARSHVQQQNHRLRVSLRITSERISLLPLARLDSAISQLVQGPAQTTLQH